MAPRHGGQALPRIDAVTIHQMQLRYEPLPDRLLLSVRTHGAELYAAWLTRRMAAQLAGPLRLSVARLALPASAAGALPVPEAQQMLEQVARQRPLPGAHFNQPFADAGNATYPLGPEPLLPEEINVASPPTGGLVISLRELRGRRLELKLNNDLATALLRLFDQAVAGADWGLPSSVSEAVAVAPQHLN